MSNKMSKNPWIQVSIDCRNLKNALREAQYAIAMDAEWVEVGTPLLTFAGIDIIKPISEFVRPRTVVADFKALDGVAQYFKFAGELGANVATVMAVANEASILKAIETGHNNDVKIQVDMLGIPSSDLAQRAKELSQMGADYFLLHLAIDELLRNPHADPLEGLDELASATDVPVGPVVFSNEQGVQAVQRGAKYVVIGYPFMNMPNAEDRLKDFAASIRSSSPL